MSDNKYLEKIAKRYPWFNAGDHAVRDAMRSRVGVSEHKIGKGKDSTGSPSNRMRVEKRSVLEKRALSSLSKGFKFTASTSGVAKTKPKLLTAEKTLKAPKPITEVSTNNPNKTMVKKSSAKDLAKKILKDTASFSKNTVVGSGKAIRDSGKGTLQHAFGGKMRGFAKKDLKMVIPSERESFLRLSDADKLDLVKNPKLKKELKTLIQKRDAAKAVTTVGSVGATAGMIAGGKKVGQKMDEAKRKRQQRRNELLMRQYYSRGY